MKIPSLIGWTLAAIFAVVGLTFLFYADGVLVFFNALSSHFGMQKSPVAGVDFYLILTAGYMYLVTLLAINMARKPENPTFPLLLAHGKIASSILSFGFFILHAPYLIYLANGIVDGAIGALAIILYVKTRANG